MVPDMDELMDALQDQADKKIHSVMHQKITDLTEQPDIKKALYQFLTQMTQEFVEEYPYVYMRSEGTWDGRHNVYRFYLRPISVPYEEDSQYTKFLYGEIYIGSKRSQYHEHIVGYRIQIEDACRLLPIGIANRQLFEIVRFMDHIYHNLGTCFVDMEFKTRISKVEMMLQELYDYLEFSGKITDVPSFAEFLKTHIDGSTCRFRYNARRRALEVTIYGENTICSIDRVLRIHTDWYTRIKI